MYESHFGLSGPPFSLNPDPDFYFQSKGHGHALSYLRFGVHQGEGFVVVTGDIGAGKTTLVRTLLSELDDAKIVAAQIVSTQLDAGDLLRSVAISFGIPIKALTKAELIASIEAFLTLLVTQGRRALLIIDEAQNLHLQAIEELRMLSNFQLGNHALLQSFLVGQPELRTLLTSKPMEQFRQRVIASCHLGPMDRDETQRYIEHRLHKVGWSDRPRFEPAAFDQIHAATAGVPRRVNLLCSRLLLSTYLTDQDVIDGAMVDAVADEARSEVGDSAVVPTVSHAEPLASGNTPALAPWRRPAVASGGPMLCVAADGADDIKMAMLLRALQQRKEAPPLVHVRVGEPAEFAPNDAFLARIGLDVPTIEVDVSAGTAAARMAEVMRDFARLVDLHKPAAVVVIGSSDAALACALVADKTGCRVAHLDGGRRGANRHDPAEVNRALLWRIADAHCTSDRVAYEALVADGASESRVLLTGDLLSEAVTLARSSTESGAGPVVGRKPGYCVVLVKSSIDMGDRRYLAELLTMLRKLSRDVPIVWPMSAAFGAQLESLGLRKSLRDANIDVVQPLGYVEQVALLGGARYVLTDSHDVRQEAAILDVPALLLEMRSGQAGGTPAALLGDLHRQQGADAMHLLRSQSRTQAAPLPHELHPGERIADHLTRWIGVEELDDTLAT